MLKAVGYGKTVEEWRLSEQQTKDVLAYLYTLRK